MYEYDYSCKSCGHDFNIELCDMLAEPLFCPICAAPLPEQFEDSDEEEEGYYEE